MSLRKKMTLYWNKVDQVKETYDTIEVLMVDKATATKNTLDAVKSRRITTSVVFKFLYAYPGQQPKSLLPNLSSPPTL